MTFIAMTVAALLAQQPANPHAGHQAHAPAAAPVQAATPAPVMGRMTTAATTIGALLANPAARAVVERHLPGLGSHPMIGRASGMTLRQVQQFAPVITNEKLAAIDTDLAALPAS